MMTRLQAEESLNAATIAALGAGTIGKWDSANIRSRLQAQAAGGRRAPRVDPTSDAGKVTLALMGIGVVDA